MVVLTRENKKTKQTLYLVLPWECKQLYPKGRLGVEEVVVIEVNVGVTAVLNGVVLTLTAEAIEVEGVASIVVKSILF